MGDEEFDSFLKKVNIFIEKSIDNLIKSENTTFYEENKVYLNYGILEISATVYQIYYHYKEKRTVQWFSSLNSVCDQIKTFHDDIEKLLDDEINLKLGNH